MCLVLVMVALLAVPVLAAKDPGKGNPDKPAKNAPAGTPAPSSVKPPGAPANPQLKALKNGLVELHRLRVQTNNIFKQIASLKLKIKTAWESLRAQLKRLAPAERAAILQALRAKLAGLKSQATQVVSELKALREQRRTKWAEFKAAVQAKNVEAARTALASVISLQSQILGKAKALESIVVQIWDAVKDVKPAKAS
ncbi:MAG: hypothetical protein Q8P50_01610 [Bacillota bacterium]|nr:hypothetical protein [Bacillota bacterium]